MNGKAIRSWQINLLHTKNLRGTMALRTLLGSHPESVIWETEKKYTNPNQYFKFSQLSISF